MPRIASYCTPGLLPRRILRGWHTGRRDGHFLFADIEARPRTGDRFAAYNGTAPIEWSSGNPKHPIRGLSRRGNRTLNHVIHIAAVTQLRHRHSPGREFYDRKRAEGMTSRSAVRALKRRISNVIYRHFITDAARQS